MSDRPRDRLASTPMDQLPAMSIPRPAVLPRSLNTTTPLRDRDLRGRLAGDLAVAANARLSTSEHE